MRAHCISEQLEFKGFDDHNAVAAFDGGAIDPHSYDAGKKIKGRSVSFTSTPKVS